MSKELKIMILENRISTLEHRNKDNARIVNKLRRQLKNLNKANS